MKNPLLAALLVPVLFSCAPDTIGTAWADDSALTGITIPRSGASFDGQTSNFTALLRAVATDQNIKLVPAGDVEVFVWKGDNFRRDRVKFTQSGLQSALEAAGYTVKEITDDIFHVNQFEHFSDDAPLRPSLTEQTHYFKAVNTKSGKALVGSWIDFDTSLTLSLLPVQYKAAPAAKPLPAAGSGLLVKDINDTAASLPRPSTPSFPNLARKPRTVRGYLKDSGGRPIVGGEVAVHVSAGGGFRTTHKARSNAQGLYEVLLPAGVAEVVQVDTDVVYNGQKFKLALEPVGAHAKQFNATQGHVENYVLRAQQGASGGTIFVKDNLESGVVEITITPQGPLMGGGAGRTLIYRYNTGDGRHEAYLNGMPLGRYRLTARLLDDGDALPLRVQNSFGYGKDTTLRSSLQVDFEPGYTYSQYNPGKSNSGVKYFPVTLEP